MPKTLFLFLKLAYQMNLNNKIVIVTGGSGLLGSEIIKDINNKNGIAVNLDVNIKNNLCEYQIETDISCIDSVRNSIKYIESNIGPIFGLVNNAYPRTSDWSLDFEKIPVDSWKKNIDLQLNSHIFLIQKILPLLKKRKYGSIINIASIYGVVSNDPTIYFEDNMTTPAAYTAIKGGMINFTKYLAAYYGSYNIRVNCISPGGIFDNQPKNFVKNYSKRVPLGRMANPDDIAPAISFLISDESKYISGQNLIIDGGWTSI